MKRLAVALAGAVLVLAGVLPSASAATQAYLNSGKAWDGSPLVTYATAVGPGRVAWSDNSRRGGAVWTRTATRTSTGFTLGAATQIGNGATRYLSISGTRTAWIQLGTATVFLRSGGVTRVVRQGAGANHGPYGVTLSGTRMLLTDTYRGPDLLLDLRTGRWTDLAGWGADPSLGASLWGDDLGFGKPDGSMWVRNLATGVFTQLAGPMPTDSCCRYGGVSLGAHHATWGQSWSYRAPDQRAGGDIGAIVDLRTGVVTPAPSHACCASNDGFIDIDYNAGPTGNPTLVPWDGSAPMRVPDITEPFLAIDGPYMVRAVNRHPGLWPLLSLLPHAVHVSPEFLGNAVASAGLVRKVSRASVIAVLDSVIRTCRVEVRTAGGSLVRSLGCAASWQQGEIRAVWDGRSATGAYVSKGTYRWTIVAANGADRLLNSDGSTTPVSGTFAVG